MVSFQRGGWNVNVVCIQSKRKHTCLKLKTKRLNFEVFFGKWFMWSMIFTQGAMKISVFTIKGFLACVYYMYLDGTSSRKKERNDLGIKLWIGTHVTSPKNSFSKFDSGYLPKAEAILLPLLVKFQQLSLHSMHCRWRANGLKFTKSSYLCSLINNKTWLEHSFRIELNFINFCKDVDNKYNTHLFIFLHSNSDQK